MPAVPVRDRTPRIFRITEFTGGLCLVPASDRDAEKFQNFDMQRDGVPVTRLGVVQANTTSLGAALCNGGGLVDAGGDKIVIAKKGTTWYYVAIDPSITFGNPAYAFTSFTVPSSPVDDPVRMESVLDTNGNRLAVFVNPNFAGLIKFDGTTASTIAGSPVGKYVRWYQGHLFTAGLANPYSVQFSDASDPLTWPTTNQFYVPSGYGAVTGLEIQPGYLAIFCEKGILAFQGDSPLNSRIVPIHTNIGCVHPNTISTFGSVTAFYYNGALMALDGNVKILSENIRGVGLSHSGGVESGAWGLLTPFNYILNQGSNPNTVSHAAYTASGGNIVSLYVYDRVKFQHWSLWTYDITSPAGGTLPWQFVVFATPQYGFYMPGGDGNLYYQPFRENGSIDQTTGLPTFTLDQGGYQILSAYRSRRLMFGDSTMQKSIRQVLVGGQGTNCALQYILWDAGETRTSTTALTGVAMPIESNVPANTGLAGLPDFSEAQMDLQGRNIMLRGFTVAWIPRRFSTIVNLTA